MWPRVPVGSRTSGGASTSPSGPRAAGWGITARRLAPAGCGGEVGVRLAGGPVGSVAIRGTMSDARGRAFGGFSLPTLPVPLLLVGGFGRASARGRSCRWGGGPGVIHPIRRRPISGRAARGSEPTSGQTGNTESASWRDCRRGGPVIGPRRDRPTRSAPSANSGPTRNSSERPSRSAGSPASEHEWRTSDCQDPQLQWSQRDSNQ